MVSSKGLRLLFIGLLCVLLSTCTTEPTPIYTLTATSTPAEGGSVSPASGEYDEGATATVTASANEGYVFSNWSGASTGSQNPVTVTMNANKSLTAVFEKLEYPFTVEVEGNGTVTETVVPQRTTNYDHGTLLQIDAEPGDGWEFSHWEGDITGTDISAFITIDEAKTVTAVFVQIEFSISTSVTGEGSIDISPEKEVYNKDEEVTIRANAENGWQFTGWEGDLEGESNPVTVSIDSDIEANAIFERADYDLTVNVQGSGTVNEEVVSTPARSTHAYETQVQLTAVPDEGWEFVEWTGDLVGDENPTTITIDGENEVTAVFELIAYELTVNIEGEGTVQEETIQMSKTTEYSFNSQVQLTAIPDNGWEFSHWEGDITGSDNSTQITINGSKEVSAIFIRKQFSLNITVEGQGSVQEQVIQQAKASQYSYETQVRLTADPENGWEFSHWDGDIAGDINPVTISVNQDQSIRAVFTEIIELQLWECDDFFGCKSSFRSPDQISLPYSSSSVRIVATTSSAVTNGRYFLRALGKTYTITNVQAFDRNNVTSAAITGIDNGTKVEPGEDVEFRLLSGKTGGSQADLVYSFEVKNEDLDFHLTVLLIAN